MAIEITDRQTIISVTDELKGIIQRCADKTLVYEDIDFEAECHITLVDDESIKKLNGDFRGVDRPTDVLSFPLLNFEGNIQDLSKEDIKYDKNPETGCVMLGDIVISLERARDQAKEYGHSLQRELGFLTVHGMLHLLGYDHEEYSERTQMREREEYVLRNVGLVR